MTPFSVEADPKKCLTNRHYSAFAQFRTAIDDSLHKMPHEYLPELKNLLTRNFQFFPFPSLGASSE